MSKAPSADRPEPHAGAVPTAHGLATATVALLERLRTPIWIFDLDRAQVAWANSAALRVWEAADIAELAARDLSAEMSLSVKMRLEQLRDLFERGPAAFSEVWTLYPGGRPKTQRVTFSGQRLGDGRMAILCEALGEINDTPERVRSAEALIHTPVMITLYGPEQRPLYRNTAAAASIPHLGEPLAERFVDAADRQRLEEMVAGLGHAVVTARMRTRAGVRWHEISARTCRDAVSGRPALLVSETDVTALKTAEEQVRFLAEHDLLTGLPNRTFLQREVARRIEAAREAGSSLALLFIDLDRFKTINDSLGHQAGDALLVAVADRLTRAAAGGDLVARLGGDEFLVCIDLGRDGDARERTVAQAILEAFEAPIRVGSRELVVSGSIGISRFPADGRDLDTLMRHADLAMYAAKDQGCSRWVTFDRAMTDVADSQLAMESSLRRALERGEFELYYQPRLSIADDRIIGAEALLRWHHPTRGLLLPGCFIPFAEKTGLITRIGESVMREAALQQRAWADAGHDVTVSVNMSGRQFRDPRLPTAVAEILAETGSDPCRMQIEITESVLVGDDATSVGALRKLSELGFSIAIDDFGTGYSNLATLQFHPIDVLKIDRSFVATLETRPELAELIIGMCRLLDMRIVAEGVETEEQLGWLRARNCHEYQGYLFSPAIPVDSFDALLTRQKDFAADPGDGVARSPLWDLVPMVNRTSDLEWGGPAGAPSKVRRLRALGAATGFRS
ncbi:EAL domain-containing protein [Siculibacillus lacustris]|uniref:EAL domain-containing protein n=1 Tax=Siculibacillus lacustris TaxID=1549641 RepID=A0A4Q9VVH1_9HYPH|nr:EAL domain-containing protein [Siculibacillus lacustris]TBW39740.1 EAL domain-containing protein [Siculibacillus lacustris]